MAKNRKTPDMNLPVWLIDILFEKCYSITRFCQNPLKVEDDWIKDYSLEEEI